MSNNYIFKELVDILVVEDNEIDAEAIQRAFKKANITNTVHSACDGVEALEMLRGENGKPKLPQPCIILLDINMPRMDGIKLLTELRSHQTLKQSIVFMLTTSARNEDRTLAYALNAAGYIVKQNLHELTDMLNIYCYINKFPVCEKEISI